MGLTKRIFIIALVFTFFLMPHTLSMEEVLESQKDSLNVSSFIKGANSYAKETFPDMNLNELFNSAIKGKVDTSLMYKVIIGMLGKEIISAIRNSAVEYW